jgi:hypothetical protein
VSRQLHAHLPATEIVSLLEGKLQNCGRHVPRSEIVSAVQNSLGCAWQPNRSVMPKATYSKWPAINQERREAIIHEGTALADLWELSPIRIADNQQHTESIIDRLFPGNPLLCCGKSSSDFDTKPREEWRGHLTGLQLIVPSPMTAKFGRKKSPKPDESEWSAHTLDNTGPRRFLVVEFDPGDIEKSAIEAAIDEQAAILIHLAGYAAMVCALHSGGKSLHGWFLVADLPEEKVLKFFRYAVSLGADSQLWCRSQFCRMPDGTRDGGKRQTVYYLNLNPITSYARRA